MKVLFRYDLLLKRAMNQLYFIYTYIDFTKARQGDYKETSSSSENITRITSLIPEGESGATEVTSHQQVDAILNWDKESWRGI